MILLMKNSLSKALLPQMRSFARDPLALLPSNSKPDLAPVMRSTRIQTSSNQKLLINWRCFLKQPRLSLRLNLSHPPLLPPELTMPCVMQSWGVMRPKKESALPLLRKMSLLSLASPMPVSRVSPMRLRLRKFPVHLSWNLLHLQSMIPVLCQAAQHLRRYQCLNLSHPSSLWYPFLVRLFRIPKLRCLLSAIASTCLRLPNARTRNLEHQLPDRHCNLLILGIMLPRSQHTHTLRTLRTALSIPECTVGTPRSMIAVRASRFANTTRPLNILNARTVANIRRHTRILHPTRNPPIAILLLTLDILLPTTPAILMQGLLAGLQIMAMSLCGLVHTALSSILVTPVLTGLINHPLVLPRPRGLLVCHQLIPHLRNSLLSRTFRLQEDSAHPSLTKAVPSLCLH